jgi:hypothetical protein
MGGGPSGPGGVTQKGEVRSRATESDTVVRASAVFGGDEVMHMGSASWRRWQWMYLTPKGNAGNLARVGRAQGFEAYVAGLGWPESLLPSDRRIY